MPTAQWLKFDTSDVMMSYGLIRKARLHLYEFDFELSTIRRSLVCTMFADTGNYNRYLAVVSEAN